MSFTDDIKRFEVKVAANSRKVFVNSAAHVFESIVNGSSVTGAPGQPVDTGFLRLSWQGPLFPDANTAEVITKCEYAEHVENNVRGVTFKNHGPHSVRLTVLGFPRILAAEVAKVNGG